MGPYILEAYSIIINELTSSKTAATVTVAVADTTKGSSTAQLTTAATIQPSDKLFGLEFTIINRNFTEDLNNPYSADYQMMVTNITSQLSNIYRGSSLGSSFRYCQVTGLRLGSVKVSCNCFFASKDSVTSSAVQTVFSLGTNGTQLLGGIYKINPISLQVQDKETPATASRLPQWAIFTIIVSTLFVSVLLMCSLFVICKNRRHARRNSYNMKAPPHKLLYTHLS
ncbi:uncharacterized protein LOC120538263 [Polypterus senegalus]|uniref:uncharacterized protein LOC120538263 n=1 Tax=Polypterus senegalus TaxID=55291 RepID=UPI0019627A08|nr:uncharacterized protein LOC120538263 [Polypterus senegalus]